MLTIQPHVCNLNKFEVLPVFRLLSFSLFPCCMCWRRSIPVICPAFSLVSSLEQTPPHFLPYPRALLLPEKSQKFLAFSILEVSIHLLLNSAFDCLSVPHQVWGFVFVGSHKNPVYFPFILPDAVQLADSSDSSYLVTQCLEQEHVRHKSGCCCSHPQGEGTMYIQQPKTSTAVISQEQCWHC